MRSDLARAAKILVMPTIGVAVVVALLPGRVELAVRIYALVLCATVVLLTVGALRRVYPPATPLRHSGRAHASRRAIPGSLARLEQEAALGVAGSFDLHHRLRPRLRSLASELLAARHGVSLDAEPAQARALLGDETWELVRSDRPPPEDRLARGLPIRELRLVVESLEQA